MARSRSGPCVRAEPCRWHTATCILGQSRRVLRLPLMALLGIEQVHICQVGRLTKAWATSTRAAIHACHAGRQLPQHSSCMSLPKLAVQVAYRGMGSRSAHPAGLTEQSRPGGRHQGCCMLPCAHPHFDVDLRGIGWQCAMQQPPCLGLPRQRSSLACHLIGLSEGVYGGQLGDVVFAGASLRPVSAAPSLPRGSSQDTPVSFQPTTRTASEKFDGALLAERLPPPPPPTSGLHHKPRHGGDNKHA